MGVLGLGGGEGVRRMREGVRRGLANDGDDDGDGSVAGRCWVSARVIVVELCRPAVGPPVCTSKAD